MSSNAFPGNIFEWVISGIMGIGALVAGVLYRAIGQEVIERQEALDKEEATRQAAITEAIRAHLAETKELWMAFEALRTAFETHRGKTLETMATRTDMESLNMRLVRMEERLTTVITGAMARIGNMTRDGDNR